MNRFSNESTSNSNNIGVISELDISSNLNLRIINNDEHEIPFNLSDSNSSDDESTGCLLNFFNDDNNLMIKKIVQWSVSFNITNTALSGLLKVFKTHKCFNNFPVDSRTILKTNIPNNKQKEIQLVPPGIYYHFGVENGLKLLSNYLNFPEETIKIFIGIDGLPLTKSSSSAFWPILGSVRIEFVSYPVIFLIGLYWGKDKPNESNLFLKDLVNELKELAQNGMRLSSVRKFVSVYGFCCDAPAKSFVLKTKGHTGFFSCSRCTVPLKGSI